VSTRNAGAAASATSSAPSAASIVSFFTYYPFLRRDNLGSAPGFIC
jgi:hypothetical protein